MALEHYDTIRDNPSDATAITHIDTSKEVIDKVIQLNHYPKAWSIPTREKYLEAKVAIERIMECGEASPNEEILGVAPDATKQDKLAAWRTLGCLIHPYYARQRNAEAAFERLKDAVEKDLDEDDIAHVVNWDGEDDLSKDRFNKEDPNVPEPPERVTRIYNNATPSLRNLSADPDDGMISAEIEGFNADIMEGNLGEGVEEDTWTIPISFFEPHYRLANEAYDILDKDPTNEKATQELTQLKAVIDGKIQKDYFPKEWTIKTAEDYIKMGLLSKETNEKAERASEAAENAKTLFQKFEEQRAAADEATKADLESTEETAKAAVASAEAAAEKAKAEAARRCWSYAAAAAALETANGECTKAKEAEGAVNDALSKAVAAVEAAKNKTKAKAGRIEYPWTTMKIDDRERIVGYRMIGKIGRQVCVETEEDDGRIIRRLESASDVGLPEVQQYIKMTGHKNLAEDQSTWSMKDREDFKELLYVTTSQIKRKNTAANGKNPNAYCCVRFTKKGMNMLTVTSLGKVLGTVSANRQIKMACKRDGILPPWDAGWASHYHDEAKVEQDPEKARAKRDDQAKANSRDRSRQRSDEAPQRTPSPHSEAKASDLRSKVDKLESKVDDMAAKMSKLDDMNKRMEELAALLMSFGRERQSAK
ncbi:hypothetical protein QBC46DRAFT_425994 [Diplogelasinospora grovesii]|uniref:Uncharacterized protein n=1 Tax=Diplogelasinospora grovesii TaxID=303347 RepID=A0AAN6MX77_9PEZI|nr:hypothetical protein QBC46DRAFT_425994 [Diplogelasinospora grovesii]